MINKFSHDFINSVYEFNEFTLNELICKLAQKMDEVITQANESFNYLEWLKKQGLSDEVIKIMLEWKENGSLETLINDVLFQNIQNDIGAINSKLDNIAKLPNELNGNIYGKIVLDKNKTYIIENNLILNDNVIIDGRGATIKFDGVINIGNNVEIYNCNFKTLTSIEREENIPTTEKSITLNVENKVGFILKNCSGNGVEVNLNNASNFIIENNNFKGGYSIVGIIQCFNNSNNGIIRNNKLNGCYTNGIGLHACNNIVIELNECFKNGHSGIYTPYSNNLKIINNKCYNHKIYDGIDANFSADTMNFSDNFNSVIENNICYNNGATGIYVSGSGITVRENQLYRNGTNGLRIAKWGESDTSRSNSNNIINNIIYNNNTKNNLVGSSLNHNVLLDGVDNSIIKDNIVYIDDDGITNFEFNMYINGNNNIIQLNYAYDSRLSNINNNTVNIVGNYNKSFKNITSYNDKNFLQSNGIIIENSTPSEILLNINNSVRCNGQGDFTVLRSLELPFYGDGINSFSGVNNNSICISKQNNGSGQPTYYLTLKQADGNYYIAFTKS